MSQSVYYVKNTICFGLGDHIQMYVYEVTNVLRFYRI
jgi:hypothetical protein